MTRTHNPPPSEEVAMSSVMTILRAFLPPNNSPETPFCHLRTPNPPNYLLRVAHNRNHLAARALNRVILLPFPTTTLTRKTNTMVLRTTLAMAYPSPSSSTPQCSSPGPRHKALRRLKGPSKSLVPCSLNRTIMVVGFTVSNTRFRPQLTTI